MRTSEQIYHQIRWDARFQAADYRLGVQIRQGPVQEIPLLRYQPGGDIPWHRILYIKGPRGLVWNRDGLDQLIPDQQNPMNWPLSLLVWNLCAGKHGMPWQGRLPAISKRLEADVIALFEVGDEVGHHLLSGPYRYHHQEMFVALKHPPQQVDHLNLSPGKDALLFHYPQLQLAVAHFTSNFRASNEELRERQWQALSSQLKAPWVVLGDLNASDHEISRWECQDFTPPQPSFPSKNKRYQRILASPELDGHSYTEKVGLSDHDPLYAQLQKPERNHQNALAILPPHHQPIQDIRSRYDPAFERWPPHINLVYPGPSLPNYDRLRLALADIPRFTVKFEHVKTFQHHSSVTYYWEPTGPWLPLLQALGCPQITPHLTLGKLRKSVDMHLEPWQFEVAAVDHLLNQELVHSIPLRPRIPLYDRIRQRCLPLVVGSSIYLETEDLDLVTTQLPAAEPEERQFPSLLRGRGYDLGDSTHWQGVLDRDALFTYTRKHRPHFQQELQQLYLKLKTLGLKGQAWGLPGGLAWAVILASQATDLTRPIGLHRHDPSGKPMTVWSPEPPGTNLTAHVPAEFLPILTQEEYEPEPPYLELRATHGMELVIDLLRQFKARLRPFVHEDGCILSFRGADPQRVLQHAKKLGYTVSLRDG